MKTNFFQNKITASVLQEGTKPKNKDNVLMEYVPSNAVVARNFRRYHLVPSKGTEYSWRVGVHGFMKGFSILDLPVLAAIFFSLMVFVLGIGSFCWHWFYAYLHTLNWRCTNDHEFSFYLSGFFYSSLIYPRGCYP